MFYTIYKITNSVNGKIYIGSHKTTDINDNYMGSGKYLKYAQNKYGIDNFVKTILFVFDTPELMYKKEAELVNECFLLKENTYNLSGRNSVVECRSSKPFVIGSNPIVRSNFNKTSLRQCKANVGMAARLEV